MEKTRKDGEMKALLTLMLKSQLRTEQRLREDEACLFDTFIGPAESLFLNQLAEQTQHYGGHIKGKKDHGLGPPHVYACLGFLEGLMKNHKQEVGAQNCQAVEKWAKELEELPWEAVADQVRMFKLSKVFDKEKRRLTFCLAPQLVEERKAVAGCLEQLGWVRKYGKAPPSHMEREPQEFLDSLVAK